MTSLESLLERMKELRAAVPDEMVPGRTKALDRYESALYDAAPTLLALAELCLEAKDWLDDGEAHAEANGTGRIREWMRRFDSAAGRAGDA